MSMTPSSQESGSSGYSPLSDWLAQTRVGSPQTFHGIVIWPLVQPGDAGPAFRTLDEAIAAQQAQVTEVSKGGSVPQLRVVNRSPDLLLILDGEELIGAKQNRVVNTTLLLPANSETTIPVTCTEQGRWHSVSSAFSSSDVVMEMKIRRAKLRSVSDHLREGHGPASDQGQVWAEIDALQQKAEYCSPTSAMHEVFQGREKEMRAALDRFACQPGQYGLAVAIRGRILGCDLLARQSAYARLHEKLVRSYVLDALLEPPQELRVPAEGEVAAFLAAVTRCNVERFPSVGCGESWRFRNGTIAGAGLVLDTAVIHLAAFSTDPAEEADSSLRRMQLFSHRSQRFFGRRGE